MSMVVLVALLALGGISVLASRGGIGSAGHERFKAVALYAAESGIAAAMQQIHDGTDITTFLRDNHQELSAEDYANDVSVFGSGIKPGEQGNLFSADANAWYEVRLRNNVDDPDFDADPTADRDSDGRLIIRSTGYGPGGAAVVLEVELAQNGGGGGSGGIACEQYSQEGENAKGTGYDNCIASVDGNDVNALDIANAGAGN